MTSGLDVQTLIERSIVSAQQALDSKDYETFATYFMQDGKLFRPTSDEPLAGRDEIVASYQKNPETRVNRHLISNITIKKKDDRRLKSISYVTLYSADTEGKDKPVTGYPVQRCLLGEFHDQWVLHNNQWKIEQRQALFTLNMLEK